MSDFLERMATSSARRAAEARSRIDEPALRRRIERLDAPPPLRLHDGGFELIAEVKRRAPSSGSLAATRDRAATLAVQRAREYAAAGAAAISVLTEPELFDGSLDDLQEVAAAVTLPVMRKDFLVDPYQLYEARAAGAAGVLLILRLLDDRTVGAMLDAAAACGLFVLLEAFDLDDLRRAPAVLSMAADRVVVAPLGLNARDLVTLTIDRGRLERLSGEFPPDSHPVAESGLDDAADAARMAAHGYRAALVGSALMRADDPAALAAAMIAAGRASARALLP